MRRQLNGNVKVLPTNGKKAARPRIALHAILWVNLIGL